MTPPKRPKPRKVRPTKPRRHPPRPAVPFPWDAVAHDDLITRNFRLVEQDMVDASLTGIRPSSDLVQQWHRASLRGVPLAETFVAGGYRGQGPINCVLRSAQVKVGGIPGHPAARVSKSVAALFDSLEQRLDELDGVAATAPVTTYYGKVLEVCAWVHGEWIRIHPFVNHNGSTARLLTRMIALRYGIPLNLPGKPRTAIPAMGMQLTYDVAANNQMMGTDATMEVFLDRVVQAALRSPKT